MPLKKLSPKEIISKNNPTKVCNECFGLFKVMEEVLDLAKSNNADMKTLCMRLM